jgi:cytochrome c556
MKTRRALATTCLILATLTTSGQAFAHGSEEHGTMKMDAPMQKLHAMMPVFSLASAQLETALEKGDALAAGTEAGKILAAVPDLKLAKPHKHAKQRKKFLALATNLEQSVTATNDLAQRGDFAGAKVAFKRVEETCAACHAKFR